MQDFNFNLKNSIFTKQAIKAAREKAIKREAQDSTASSNEVKNLLEQKCDNAGIFRDLTDEEVEARLKSEEQSPLSLIKNLINNKHKIDSSGVNFVTNQRNDLSEKDSSGVLPPQNDAFRHTEQSEVSQSIQCDGEILRHFVPHNDSLPTAGAIEDSETVLIPNDGDSGVSQPFETELSLPIGGLEDESVIDETANQTEFTPTPTPVENRANATSSLTIKDADGAKPQTLAAGDKLNVTYVYEGKTFNYTIEAKSAQNVTLQTKDGYFTVVGDNLAVQTGDEQYSFVALIGTTNSIKIGTNGKTYNGNSIAYNSDEGGHSIYTWGDTPEPKSDYKMSRGETKTIRVTQEEQILELTNPFDNTKHYYTLKMRDDITPASNSAVNFTQQSVKFQFLANGRLVVTGSYVDIEAFGGQKDDLIILGHYNKVSTGDEDDIVRLGFTSDGQESYRIDSACKTTENGQSTDLYIKSTSNNGIGYTTNNVNCYTAVGNKVDTGVGNDYINVLLNKDDNIFNYDMGEGDDSLKLGNHFVLLADSTALTANQKARMENVEYLQGRFEIESESKRDGIDGWSFQFGSLSDHGICAFLSLINSLCQVDDNIDTITQKRKLSDYVDIKYDGTNYTVTFLNYDPTVWKTTTNSVTVSKSIIDAAQGARGDIDTIIVANAFDQILKINKDSGVTNAHGAQNNVFSRYFYGDNYFTQFGNFPYTMNGRVTLSKTEYIEKLLSYWQKYKNNEISSLTFGIHGNDDYSVGKVGGHMYAIRNITTGPDGKKYIELINPWDDRDCVRYDLETINQNWNITFQVHGYDTSQDV